MQDAVHIYFVGTAGAGKTTLQTTYGNWLIRLGADPVFINLDPGVLDVPYVPHIDIREWIVLDDLMKESGLGPNGAQIAAADLLAVEIHKVAELLEDFRTTHFLLDTPGQIELFAFRTSSKVVVEALGQERALLAFIFDPMLSRTASGFISLLMLATTVQLRFGLPVINILGKSDLLEEFDKERIVLWSQDAEVLYSALLDEGVNMLSAFSGELFKALETIQSFPSLIPCSSETKEGLEELHNSIQMFFAGGEDLDL